MDNIEQEKLSTMMTIDELREELDAIVMTKGKSREIVLLAEAASRLITLATRQTQGET